MFFFLNTLTKLHHFNKRFSTVLHFFFIIKLLTEEQHILKVNNCALNVIVYVGNVIYKTIFILSIHNFFLNV